MSYPFLHWLGINAGELLYVIEDSSYFGMLSCMVFLTYLLSNHFISKKTHAFFFGLSILFILLPIVSSYLIFSNLPTFITTYGSLITVYKLFMALYLMIATCLATYKGKSPIWLLAGNAMFGFGIFVDYLSAGKFEPIRFGWHDEYSGFLIVLMFTALMIQQHCLLAKENDCLQDHLQEEVAEKTSALEKMLEDRRRFLSSAAHDLKAPVSVIQMYIDFIKDTNVEIDEELENYLSIIRKKTSQMIDNVQTLQEYNAQDSIQEQQEYVLGTEFIQFVFEETKPYVDASDIPYHIHLIKSNSSILIQKTRLFRALENIILNAVEHSNSNGEIILDISKVDDYMKIEITNHGDHIPSEILPHIFEYGFSTKRTPGEHGIGLYFTKQTIEEHGGQLLVDSSMHQSTSFIIFLPCY